MSVPYDPLPEPPAGYLACRAHDGAQKLIPLGASRQITHLVPASRRGGPTACGLTRFPSREADGVTVARPADLPGWNMGGGVHGPGIEQVRCAHCWDACPHPIERTA